MGINETHILNTFLRKVHENEKQGILDVRIAMNDDTEIDVEIQLVKFQAWAERSLFYIAKMYTEQIEIGQEYDVLKKCVSISILDFKLLDGNEFYSCFHLREDVWGFLYTDKMEFYVIELPKLPKELKEGSNDLFLWAKFINAERKEDFEMIAEKNQYIGSAYKRLQHISQDKQMQLEYEAREKAVRDHNQMIKEARKDGEQIGREKEAIEIYRDDLGLTRMETIEKIAMKFGITEEEAEDKVSQYWNE